MMRHPRTIALVLVRALACATCARTASEPQVVDAGESYRASGAQVDSAVLGKFTKPSESFCRIDETYYVDEQSLVDKLLPASWGETFPPHIRALAPAYERSRALVASRDKSVLAYRHTADGPVGTVVRWEARECQLSVTRGLHYLDGVVQASDERPDFRDCPDGPVVNSRKVTGVGATDTAGHKRDLRPLAVLVDTERGLAFDVVRGGSYPLVVEDPSFRADVPRVLLLLPSCGDGVGGACVYTGTREAITRRLRRDPRSPVPIGGWRGCIPKRGRECLMRPGE